jgi:hypothetical protein
MGWRALGITVVLLAVGVAGGYAVGQRTEPQARSDATVEPVPAVSPAVPTVAAHPVLPDPTTAPLAPDLPAHPEVLRLPRKGLGLVAQIPDGWQSSHSGDTWIFAQTGNPTNTYTLRIQLLISQRQSVAVVKGARLAALQQSQADGNMFELDVTADTDDEFEATYIDSGSYRRVTRERYVDNGSGLAYVVIAATGRTVDTEGLRDLVTRISTSLVTLAAGEPAP